MKKTTLTYDEAIRRAETLVQELQQTEALSVSTYQDKAKQVQQLLDFCQNELTNMEKALQIEKDK